MCLDIYIYRGFFYPCRGVGLLDVDAVKRRSIPKLTTTPSIPVCVRIHSCANVYRLYAHMVQRVWTHKQTFESHVDHYAIKRWSTFACMHERLRSTFACVHERLLFVCSYGPTRLYAWSNAVQVPLWPRYHQTITINVCVRTSTYACVRKCVPFVRVHACANVYHLYVCMRAQMCNICIRRV